MHSEDVQAANPGLTALVAAVIAAGAAGGGLYLWHRLGCQLILNIHDPAFNPVALGVLALFAVAVWTAEAQVDRSSDSSKGLAFSFALPGSVGPRPVPSGIVPGATRQSLTTLHIPGMARVAEATNRPPIGRFWVLKVAAPTAGPDFLAEFTVDVED